MTAGEGRGGKVRRWALRVALALGVLGVGTWAAFQLGPWPSVLLIRWVFDRGAAGNFQTKVARNGIDFGGIERDAAAINSDDELLRLLDVRQGFAFEKASPNPDEHGVLQLNAARSLGQSRFRANPPMTSAAAISFQAGSGSPR